MMHCYKQVLSKEVLLKKELSHRVRKRKYILVLEPTHVTVIGEPPEAFRLVRQKWGDKTWSLPWKGHS